MPNKKLYKHFLDNLNKPIDHEEIKLLIDSELVNSFIEKAKKIHSNKYNYKLVSFKEAIDNSINVIKRDFSDINNEKIYNFDSYEFYMHVFNITQQRLGI